jgi:hypothetical protein
MLPLPLEAVRQSPRIVRYGIPGVAGAIALGLAFNPFGIENKLEMDGGHGELLNVTYTVPELCQDAYTSNITGAEAEYSKKITLDAGLLHLGVPTGISQKSGFDGKITSQVCRDETQIKPTLDSKGKVHIKVSADAYKTFSYVTHPSQDVPYTKHNGPISAIAKNFDSFAHVIPKVEYKGAADGVAGRMGGLAIIAAQATASEQCGKIAWKYLRPMQEQSIKEVIGNDMAIAEMLNPDFKFSPDDLVIELPTADEVKMPDQYSKELEMVKKAGGSNLKVDVKSTGTCKESPDLKVSNKQGQES